MSELKVKEITQQALQPYDESALGRIALDDITTSIDILKATIPGGEKMPRGVLGAIAQDSILTRTIPGREIHYVYYKDKKTGEMKLMKIDDYKLLVRWANEKEQMMSNDPSATIKDSYRSPTEEERQEEGLAVGDVAQYCTIISRRDYADIKEMRNELDATFEEAISLVGTTAIGVVKANDNKIPSGWSRGQKARKLALKATIRFRYGQPSMDEMEAMRRRWAKRADPQDWAQVDQSLPFEAQARLANLTAIGREAQEAAVQRSPGERKVALEERTSILRGPVEEVGIGDDGPEENFAEAAEKATKFTNEIIAKALAVEEAEIEDDEEEVTEAAAARISLGIIMTKIPWFQSKQAIKDAMVKENTNFSDPDLLQVLKSYASNQMDLAAAKEEDGRRRANTEAAAREEYEAAQGNMFDDDGPY